VIIPIYKNDAEKATVMEAIEKITAGWRGKSGSTSTYVTISRLATSSTSGN
jgi:hypothetical protein